MGKVLPIEEYKSKVSTIVTIGTFDGVHVGHQKIVNRLITLGKKEDFKSVILTFFPHPRMVLQKDSNIKLINTIEERSRILDTLGLDYLLIKKFTKDFSRLSAEEFVKQVLIDKLNTKKVIIGYDHRFGRNRNADINDLIKYGKEFGFEVEEISAQDINDVAVSSTKIRKALFEGDIQKANKYLGYPFMLSGTVVKGKGIGKELDYPTANINIKEDYKLIPKQGSYVVKSVIDSETVFGMMNIGMNPTVNGKTESIEVHFFNFSKTIYGKDIQIDVLERIRDEQKFESILELKKQLQKDKLFSLNFINTL
ncbi:bifunctional riboflavin kinase/FAD synthetase [Hyunsoonleella pacifica]|uniref:Riboflavin biosynthesis protein n=1 Tax=Hyunsoonleella pacifica TaxID=1080224 RepID=A0A4Q9FN83_9FLAO|nr:bifunctional riboflavin kinase/FAD synthetase [Hyunsoonleella pacifica]TBN15717.1 bifunctional riboflavin kinase/FAD synthetase [Hyunsoonleella pacifica]GGD22046.1 riboflavin biosynthesis protein [Hyunsoonleella pacifica]